MRRVELYVNSIDDLREKYNGNVLSNEVSNYIESECLSSTKKEKIVIEVIANKEFVQEDKDDIERLIRNNYRERQVEKNIIRNYQVKQSFFLSLLGIVFIVVSNMFDNSVLSELFLIVGWVSFGEVIYKILFENIKDKIKTERYKKLSRCGIEFITKKKP